MARVETKKAVEAMYHKLGDTLHHVTDEEMELLESVCMFCTSPYFDVMADIARSSHEETSRLLGNGVIDAETAKSKSLKAAGMEIVPLVIFGYYAELIKTASVRRGNVMEMETMAKVSPLDDVNDLERPSLRSARKKSDWVDKDEL